MDNQAINKEKIQEELSESQERYKVLVETIPDIMYELDPEGRFVFVSEAVENLGYSPQELIKRHFSEIVHPEDVNKVSRDTVLLQYKGKVTGDEGAPKLFDERRTGKRATKNLEVRLLHKQKKDKPDDSYYAEVHSSGNWKEIGNERRFIGSIGIIRDISERKISEKILKRAKEELEIQTLALRKAHENIKTLYKQLEEKNRELQKLDQLKSDFLSTVSHELRTPLTTIREGVSQVLDGALGNITQQQREFLSMSLEDIERLDRIINELLDISKIEAGRFELKREFVDITELIKNICIIFGAQAKKKNLSLRQNLPPQDIKVFIDKDKIIQVITNLLGNSIKFTKEGYVEISVEEKQDCIECSVRDTGCGIAEENLPKIFDKFQQFARPVGPGEKGTGLGLSIVKGIIDLHHGKVFVNTQIDRGSKFVFTLPKLDVRDAIKDCIAKELSEASLQNLSFSVISFRIDNFDALLKNIGKEKCDSIIENLDLLIRNNLRKKADLIIRNNQPIFVILPLTEKIIAIKIVERIVPAFNNYLSEHKLSRLAELGYLIASYPQDSKTKEDFFKLLEII